MISALHHFPNAKTMTQFLLNHRALNSAYYQEKGITPLIAADLQRGEDGFTGEKLPKIELPKMHQLQFSSAILNALIESSRIQYHQTLN